MGLSQGGFAEGGRTGRRRALIVGAIVVVLLVAWTYAVMSYGGGARGGAGDARSEAHREAAQAATPKAGQSASAPTGRQGAGSQTGGALPVSEGASTPASSPASTPAAPSGERGQAAGGADLYDPLGAGASPGDLTEVDRERARFAAAQFISAAYGYTGNDEDAYNQGVGDTVVWPAFYQTEGSKEIERYASQVEKTGTRSAAKLTWLNLRQTSPYSASGYAYFDTGEGYGTGGDLTGERRAYRQHMILQRTGATWSVKATGPIQEV